MLTLGLDKCECGYDFKDLRERLGLHEPREKYGIAHYQCLCKRWYEVDALCSSGAIGLLPIKTNEVYSPIAFSITADISIEAPQRPLMTEKLMEDAIAQNPEKYLEQGLILVERQYRIGSYIFDLLFQDRHGAKLIVELQKGTLDRNHTYKILDYYDEYKTQNPDQFVELMVIANRIPRERRERLSSQGISFKEIPESDFLIQASRTDALHSVVESADDLEEDVVQTDWDRFALEKIEAWLREFIINSRVGELFDIGKVARQSRNVAHILPQGNIEGFRHLLEKLAFEGYIEIEGRRNFRITKHPNSGPQ
jgi:hypothetical protein